MHQYVRTYDALTDSPDISPVEHLEMLRLRDEVADLADRGVLSLEETKILAEADRRLAAQARTFAQSIGELQDLASLRTHENIHAARWWWYLDVLSNVPVDHAA